MRITDLAGLLDEPAFTCFSIYEATGNTGPMRMKMSIASDWTNDFIYTSFDDFDWHDTAEMLETWALMEGDDDHHAPVDVDSTATRYGAPDPDMRFVIYDEGDMIQIIKHLFKAIQ